MLGLVEKLNRQGGNLTGVTNLNVEIGQKRLELLRELLPTATNIAVLVDPSDAKTLTEQFIRNMQAAAPALRMKLNVLEASKDQDLDKVFAALGQLRADALVIGPYLFFTSRIERLGALSLRYAVPAIFSNRPFVTAGGLISYGGDSRGDPPSGRHLHRENTQRREAGRSAGPKSDKGRTNNQSQDGQSAGHRHPSRAERPSRRAS